MVTVHKQHLSQEKPREEAAETKDPQEAKNDLNEIRVDDDLQEPDPEESYEPTLLPDNQEHSVED